MSILADTHSNSVLVDALILQQPRRTLSRAEQTVRSCDTCCATLLITADSKILRIRPKLLGALLAHCTMLIVDDRALWLHTGLVCGPIGRPFGITMVKHVRDPFEAP